MRFIGGTGSNSIQHSLAQRPTDYNSRLVYDCTFGVGHGAVGALTSAGSQLLGSNNLVSGGTQVNGQIINGRYFDKLSNDVLKKADPLAGKGRYGFELPRQLQFQCRGSSMVPPWRVEGASSYPLDHCHQDLNVWYMGDVQLDPATKVA